MTNAQPLKCSYCGQPIGETERVLWQEDRVMHWMCPYYRPEAPPKEKPHA